LPRRADTPDVKAAKALLNELAGHLKPDLLLIKFIAIL
jgi:hypothetical protein